jgi:hypothetical protein
LPPGRSRRGFPIPFWQSLFLTEHPTWSHVWGPIIGPLVAVLSFVCSIGNVPLAAVLWNGGISFGGVIAFIFADLIILPILDIYRRYYGLRMAAFLFATFGASMVAAGLVVRLSLRTRSGSCRPSGTPGSERRVGGVHALGHDLPEHRRPRGLGPLVWRFFATGGRARCCG